MTRGTIEFYGDLDKKFVAYCRRRRDERGGKVIQSTTAIKELLSKALDGIEPERPLVDRVAALEVRVSNLERR